MKGLDPSKAQGYITKAEKSLEMAKIASQMGAYDNAVMSAIHSAINTLDALTTSYLGKRSSGQHTEVLSLIKGIFSSKECSELSSQFTSLLSLKNESEYQPILLKSGDAENSIKWAERILTKVQTKMKSKT